jgi:hypothetical protein
VAASFRSDFTLRAVPRCPWAFASTELFTLESREAAVDVPVELGASHREAVLVVSTGPRWRGPRPHRRGGEEHHVQGVAAGGRFEGLEGVRCREPRRSTRRTNVGTRQ